MSSIYTGKLILLTAGKYDGLRVPVCTDSSESLTITEFPTQLLWFSCTVPAQEAQRPPHPTVAGSQSAQAATTNPTNSRSSPSPPTPDRIPSWSGFALHTARFFLHLHLAGWGGGWKLPISSVRVLITFVRLHLRDCIPLKVPHLMASPWDSFHIRIWGTQTFSL